MRHHGAGLLRLTRTPALVEQLKRNYTQATLTPPQRAMLDYAVKLTLTPAKMCEQDVETLRQHNFSDRAILDINQIVGYFAYVNRLADGLGVELEGFWENNETG